MDNESRKSPLSVPKIRYIFLWTVIVLTFPIIFMYSSVFIVGVIFNLKVHWKELSVPFFLFDLLISPLELVCIFIGARFIKRTNTLSIRLTFKHLRYVINNNRIVGDQTEDYYWWWW